MLKPNEEYYEDDRVKTYFKINPHLNYDDPNQIDGY